MYEHIIRLNPADAALLHEQYQMLFRQFNRGHDPNEQYLAALKQTMHDILLSQDDLSDFWREAQRNPQQFYHLHLVCPEKEILNLPWQLAIDEHAYPRVYISKSTLPVHSKRKLKPPPGPLKILVMISSPEDLGTHNRLSYEHEEDVILKALAPLWETGQVQVDFTYDGSLESLQRHLVLEHYHVLYFSGHGSYEENTGYLLLEDERTLHMKSVKAKQFGKTLLHNRAHTPGLVVLASCQTAEGNTQHGFRGVADELTHIGIPAVIAMASSVQDYYATLFAAGLFKSLAGKESLLVAYGNALEMMKQGEQEQLHKTRQFAVPAQWLIPQLYCNRPVDYITDWQKGDNPVKTAKSTVSAIHTGRFLFLNHPPGYRFIGRRKESARVFHALLQNKPVLLRGQGGVGKTAMAEHLARRLVTHDPQYHYFAFNETSIGISHLIARLCDFLEKEHQYAFSDKLDKLEQAEQKLNFLLLATRERCKPVWIFDNMDTCQQYAGGPMREEYLQWLQYIKNNILDNSPVIFTGRYLISECPDIIDENLNQVSFTDFYRKCLQLQIKTIYQLNHLLALDATAGTLYRALGGNYRALELFDEVYKNQPGHIIGLLEKLQAHDQPEERKAAAQKRIKGAVQQKLDGGKLLFGEFFHLLNKEEIYTLQLLAQFNSPVLLHALDMQKDGMHFEKMLKRLHDITLVEEQYNKSDASYKDSPLLKYYYITPLLREWLAAEALPPIEFIHVHAGDYYLSFDKRVNDDNITDYREAFRHFSIARDVEKLHQTGIKLIDFLYTHSLYGEAFKYASEVKAIAGRKTHPYILNYLGQCFTIMGKPDKALSCFKKVYAISLEKKDKLLESAALGNMAQFYGKQKKGAAALKLYEKSLEIKTAFDTPKGICATLNNMAIIHESTGNFHKALELLEKCLATAKKAKAVFEEAGALIGLGKLYATLSSLDKAEEAYSTSWTLLENTGYEILKAATLGNLGIIYNHYGWHDKALECLKKGLDISRGIGDKNGAAKMLNAIGGVYNNSQPRKALKYLKEGLLINRTIKDLNGISASLVNLAQAFTALRMEKELLECLKENSDICEETGNIAQHIEGLSTLASYYFRNKRDYTMALKLFDEVQKLNIDTGNLIAQSKVISNRAYVHEAMGDNDKAVELFQESADLRMRIKDYIGVGEIYTVIASIFHDNENYPQYLNWLDEAYRLFDKIDHKEGVYQTGKELGTALVAGVDGVKIIFIPNKEKHVNNKSNLSPLTLGLDILKRCKMIGKNAGYTDVYEIEEVISGVWRKNI